MKTMVKNMEKPRTYAGKVVRKYGKTTTNDFAQPEKFFLDMENFLHIIDSIPFSAVQDLEKYELNRDVMINIIRRMFKILDAANVDLIKEISRQDEDPFDGLEEDFAAKKASELIKISGD